MNAVAALLWVLAVFAASAALAGWFAFCAQRIDGDLLSLAAALGPVAVLGFFLLWLGA